jgi:GxxExxY protein
MNSGGKLKREDLLYPELSYQIIGVLFEVYNELGYGYQEKYYQKAVGNKFKEINISFKEQVPIKIIFKRIKSAPTF